MTIFQMAALVPFVVAAFVSWWWHFKSMSKGRLYITIGFTSAALLFLINAIAG